jgi:hypothetical protein
MRLQSFNKNGGQFYYLTIPAGTKTAPKVENFTVASDIYYRTTWYGPGANTMCQGQMNTGELIMDRNNRLVFLPCNSIPMRRVSMLDSMLEMFDFDMGDGDWGDFDMGDLGGMADMMIMPAVNLGEPSMEKIIASSWQAILLNQAGGDSLLDEFGFNINFDDLPDDLPFDISSFLAMSTPSINMCQWRYQYKAGKNDVEFLKIPPCQPNGCK